MTPAMALRGEGVLVRGRERGINVWAGGGGGDDVRRTMKGTR